MPYRDKEKKRQSDRLYRERHAEKIADDKRKWKEDNRAKLNARAREAYHANPEAWRKAQQKYIDRKVSETGVHPSTARNHRAWAKDPEGMRKKMRDYARESYHRDPLEAARRRARTTLSATMGIPCRLIPKDLIEAKAAQLLVRRAAKERT